MSQVPVVNVFMLSYNHREFIEQAIESVLMQKTNFPYQLVIGDDASPDGSGKIVEEYSKKYPDRIVAILHKKNLGMPGNAISILEKCNGEFLAFCEGDDYWTDPLKLQKQVDFLRSRPDISLCFHPVKIYHNGDIKDDTITRDVPAETGMDDLIAGNFIHTPSVVMRNVFKEKIPDYVLHLPATDFGLWVYAATFGRIFKLEKEFMSVYRIHNTSYWSGRPQFERLLLWYHELVILAESLPENSPEKFKIAAAKSLIEAATEVPEHLYDKIKVDFADPEILNFVVRELAISKKSLAKISGKFHNSQSIASNSSFKIILKALWLKISGNA